MPVPSADLQLRLAVYPKKVVVGGNLTMVATVTNNGPDPVPGGTVTFQLPGQLAYVSSSSGCSPSGSNVTCGLGSLGVGATRQFSVVARLFMMSGQVCVSAGAVDSSVPDPNPSNNGETFCFTPDPSPNDEPPCVPACECDDECCCDGGTDGGPGGGGGGGGGVQSPPVRGGGVTEAWGGGTIYENGGSDGACGCGCGECVDTGCSERPTASGRGAGTVHLNSGRFALEKPIQSIRGVGGKWGFGLRRLSASILEVTSGPDVPGFENCQQSRVIITDNKGDSNPDNDDVAVWAGGFGKKHYRFREKVGSTIRYFDADGATARLEKDATTDEFTITSPCQTVAKFGGFNTPGVAPGRLKSVIKPTGAQRTFQYQQISGEWHLTSETDTGGRTITYTNTTFSVGGTNRTVLTEVTDFNGRKITLQWLIANNDLYLVAVVGPSVAIGAPGNTFPGGKATVFQYDTGNTNPNRRRDLIKVFYPKQVAPHLNTTTRVVDAAAVYANATPRYVVTYGQNAGDVTTYGRVLTLREGDRGSIGGTSTFSYQLAAFTPSLPAGVVLRTTMTDRNGNITVNDFDSRGNRVRFEQQFNRNKSSKNTSSVVTTWEYGPLDSLMTNLTLPEGNTIENSYDDGVIRDTSGNSLFTLRSRVGFLLKQTRKPGPRGGDQQELTTRRFPDRVFNHELVSIDPRGNPITLPSTYFTPQNGGPTPTNTDRSRYATWNRFDYQEDSSDTNKTALAAMLGITLPQFNQLLTHQDKVLKDGGLPAGFVFGLGDINGDGRTNQRMGNVIKTIRPTVTLIAGSNQATIEGDTTQEIVGIRTYNDRGQVTTETDPEGNVAAHTRYPENDPDGDGLNLIPGKSTKQYGYLKEAHVDVNPADLATLVGSGATGGDLTSFTLQVTRRNTPGVYQDLFTRYTYDRVGNVKTARDPRGNISTFDVNELNQTYRSTGPAPFNYMREVYFDEHNNPFRVDTEDKVATVLSSDPANVNFMKVAVTLEADAITANFPVEAGPGGSIRPGWFTDQSTFDFLDRPLTSDLDATGSTPARLVTTFAQDRNGNRIKLTKPAANFDEFDYDEADRLIAVRRGGNDPTVAAINAYAHEKNGNIIRVIDAADTDGSTANNDSITIQNSFGSGSPLTHTGDFATENIYDGFDRLKKSIDAVGGFVEHFYDPLGNVIQSDTRGTTGGATPTDRTGSSNQLLSRSYAYFDELARQYESQRDVFLPTGVTLGSGRAVTHTEGGLLHNSTANTHTATVTLTAGGSTYVLSRTEFDRSSRPTNQVSDGLGTAVTNYDGANRPIKTTDAEGNFEEPTYDKNGNVVQSKRTEKAQAGAAGSPAIADEIFVTKFATDVMNRQTWVETQGPDGDVAATPDNQISRTAFNSRGLATHFRDALDNTRLQLYDGAGRSLGSDVHLRVDGTGATALDTTQSGDGIIRVRNALNGNSLPISLTDDNNNVTSFPHDALDRHKRLTFADGKFREWIFDRDSNVTRFTDENGSISDRTYDALNRQKDDTITRAAGVIGTTLQTSQYDGAGRATRATDNGDPGDAAQSSVVTNVYDSLGRQLEESLQIGSTGTVRYTTGSKWSSDSDRTELSYPNGRKVQSTHDELGRLKSIKDDGAASPIATWRWMGDRVLELAYGNSSCLTHLNDARTRAANQPGYPAEIRGFDGLQRVVAHRWLQCTLDAAGLVTGYVNPTTPLIGFRHAWNAADIKLSQELMHATGDSDGYKYDSAYRLIGFERGTLNAALTEIVTLTTTPALLQRQTWTLDGPGNWPTNVTTTGGVPTTENRTHNNLNQITLIGATPLVYDFNGNLSDDGTYLFAWNAKNRLRRVTRKSDSVVVGNYSYDVLGRRMRRIYMVGTDPAKTVHYYFDGQRVIEEGEPNGTGNEVFKRQYTYGPYIDECVTLDRDLNTNGSATDSGERLFYHANTLYSVGALSDANRTQPERYLFDGYGRPIMWLPGVDGTYGTADDARSVSGTSSIENTRLFTGREWDTETRMLCFRSRFHSATQGRFLSRDRQRRLDAALLYAYVGNRPLTRLDPLGQQDRPVTVVIPPDNKPIVVKCPTPSGKVCGKKDMEPLPGDLGKPCEALRSGLEGDVQVINAVLVLIHNGCAVPPITCACCTRNCAGAGAWHIPGVGIFICAGQGLNASNVKRLILHELTHAYQSCTNMPDVDCKDRLKAEMMAQFCASGCTDFQSCFTDAVWSGCAAKKCDPAALQPLVHELYNWFQESRDTMCPMTF